MEDLEVDVQYLALAYSQIRLLRGDCNAQLRFCLGRQCYRDLHSRMHRLQLRLVINLSGCCWPRVDTIHVRLPVAHSASNLARSLASLA